MVLHKLIATIVFLMSVSTIASSKIVFTSNMEGNYEIYVMDDDGTNIERITHHPDNDFLPRWSPNGKQIAFEREKIRQPNQNQQQFDIVLMNRDGSRQQQITIHKGMHIQPQWSPDGKQIAFASSWGGGMNLYTIDIETREVKQLTKKLNGGALNMQDWSPDGKSIAYTGPSPQGWNTIYLTDANGNTQRQLLPGKEGTYRYSFQWSSDGRKMLYCEAAYQGNDLISNKIAIRNKNGFLQKEIDMSGKWFMHSVRWMGDRQLLITAEAWAPPGLPPEIYHYTLAADKLTNLTNLPSRERLGDWIDDAALAVIPVGKLTILWSQLKKQ